MERHVQSALLAVLLALVFWVGDSVVKLRDSSVELRTQVTELQRQMNAQNGRFDLYMPRTEALLRDASNDEKHREFARRLDSLERTRSNR